jgi:hypothetical protein
MVTWFSEPIKSKNYTQVITLYLPFTMLYLLARSAACTPFPDPVGPSNTILGVCGALDLGFLHRYVYTEKKN